MSLSVFYNLWMIIQVIVAAVLLFPVVSFIVYLFCSKNKLSTIRNLPENDYGIIVTAYKNADNLDNVIRSLLKMQHHNFIIYVVADGCPEFEDSFNDPRVVILKPAELFSNQLKSHFFAIGNFKRDHELITIIDSDNIVHPGYLKAFDPFFNAGYKAVQGVRKAKNLNTHYASIDAVGEIYYLFYDRKVLFTIGSSCMLSGSGMAFTTELYKDCLGSSKSTGAGFDKILQKEILQRGHRIAFAEEAIVYDEKTANAEQLVKQRARWNNTWFRYFKFGFAIMLQGIKNAAINPLLFGFVLIRPPLFILLTISALITIVNLFLITQVGLIWIGFLFLFTLGFLLALIMSDVDKRVYKSLLYIPKFIFHQLASLLKVKKANQISIATEHTHHESIEKLKDSI